VIFSETKLNLFWKTRFNFVSNLTLLATDQQYILVSCKTFVSHLHWLRLLAYEIMLEWKRLNGVTSHVC